MDAYKKETKKKPSRDEKEKKDRVGDLREAWSEER